MNPIIYFAVVTVGVLAVCYQLITHFKRLSLLNLVVVIIGAIIGLLIGSLLSGPIGRLPGLYGSVLPLGVSLLFTVGMVSVFLQRVNSVVSLLPFLRKLSHDQNEVPTSPTTTSKSILVDTSVIIDGRIADIAKAGFVPGKLLVPRFVLAELQNIADSDEAMRRGRGRRGLEILNAMRETPGLEVEIIEQNLAEIKEVDAKLVALAQRLGTNILTTDYNLNRVAQIEGVRVLNINELSNAIRPVVLPGEEMIVKIVQAGKERGQGVGYLPDGTMIVVDNGDKLIGQEVTTEVTRVFQTVAGKMIFAAPKGSTAEGNGQNRPRQSRPNTKYRHPSKT